MIKFDICRGLYKKDVCNRLTIKELVEKIRNPEDPCVEAYMNTARDSSNYFGKGTRGYDALKSIMDCVCISFVHNNKIKGDCISGANDYLYIDVDNYEGELVLNHPAVVAYWKSFSGLGYSIVVGVKGITIENVKTVTKAVSDILDVEADLNAVSSSRLTVLPKDPNIVFNENHAYIELEDLDLEPYQKDVVKVNGVKAIKSVQDSKDIYSIFDTTVLHEKGNKVRFDDLDIYRDSIDFNNKPSFDLGTKFSYNKIDIRNLQIITGNRNTVLFAIGAKFRALNPGASENLIKSVVNTINSKKCLEPLDSSEIQTIVTSILQLKTKDLENNLKNCPNKTIRYLTNPEYKGRNRVIRSHNMTQINKGRVEKSRSIIAEGLQNWNFGVDGEVKPRKLKEALKRAGKSISERTIRTYWEQFEEEVQKINLGNSEK